MAKTLQHFIPVLFITFFACGPQPKNAGTDFSSAVSQPTVKLSDLQGNAISIGDYKGKIVFLNFWATWCKPCLQEMPSIVNAQKILGTEQFVFLLASPETKDAIEEFKAAPNAGIGLIQLVNPEELNLVGLPTTYIYDTNGNLVFSEIGYRKWDTRENLDLIATANHTK